jgi:hypothetical protein
MAERRKAFRHRRQQQIGNPPRAVLLTDVQRRVVALQPFNFLPHVSGPIHECDVVSRTTLTINLPPPELPAVSPR